MKGRGLYLCVGRGQALAAVDADQRVLLDRDVELEEAGRGHGEAGPPEDPGGQTLGHTVPHRNQPRVDGAVLWRQAPTPPWGGRAGGVTTLLNL